MPDSRAIVVGRSWISPLQNHSRTDRLGRGAATGLVRRFVARGLLDECDGEERRTGG